MNAAHTFLKKFLAYPATKGLDLDDPYLTDLRRSIVREKKSLYAVYQEWYQKLLGSIPRGSGQILELGSGAGFLSDLCPEAITSEIFWCRNTRATVDGCALPFPDSSLRAIVMTDVLHHIPNIRQFFAEADRCLRPDGVIAMIEPWSTPWSRLIYRWLHHEPFDPSASTWEFPSSGPLSGANGALPWIVFQRDRATFEKEFPHLTIQRLQVMISFRYLVSGGVSLKPLFPDWWYPFWNFLEHTLTPLANQTAMFAFIVLRKTAG